MTILDSRLRGNERKVKLIRNKTGPVRAKSCLKNKTGPLRARYSEPAWGAGDTSRNNGCAQAVKLGRNTTASLRSARALCSRCSALTIRPSTCQPCEGAEVPHGHLTRSYPRKRG